MDILKKYQNIVENKQTDGTTTKAKNEAWDKIASEYNASPCTSSQASHKQLRRLWTNLKQRQRDCLTIERQHRLRTGGGPSTKDAEIDPDVSQLTPGLLVEVDGVIDSDETFETLEMPIIQTDPQPDWSENHLSTTSTLIIPSPNPHPQPSLTPLTPQLSISTISPLPPLLTLQLPSTPSTTTLVPPTPLSTSSTTPQSLPSSSSSSAIPTSSSFQRYKNSIIEKEYNERQRRANELHELEVQLLKEKIREAKAKADLADEILRQQQQPEGTPGSQERRNN